ncbi:MAG: DUF3160 domain-containing protein [Myxococcales bacterium]|nr:DUF3160 domain-containing protein [Myxococcales bacterium]
MRNAGILVLALALGCDGSSEPAEGPGEDRIQEPGAAIQVARSQAELQRVSSALAEVKGLDATGLLSRYPVNQTAMPPGDPREAAGYQLLQNSNLGLREVELERLRTNGFVIVPRHAFPSFFYGYLTVYGEDLPVFVSADSILDALHRSFDDLLMRLEHAVLVPKLTALLAGMRSTLAGNGDLPQQVRADGELFLALAEAMLLGRVPTKLSAGVTAGELEPLLHAAEQAAGIVPMELFGVRRRIDFSQFKPRGHYEGDEVLERYFRAMMWLGRIDFRLIETQDDGSQVFHRRQLEATLGLRALMGQDLVGLWNELDAIVTAFIGEHDYMILPQLDALLADLGVEGLAQLSALDDQTIASAIIDGGYGVQRISSHAMVNGGVVETLPLNVSFAFLGQRYALDSHVFSNLVHDRVGGRWLPDPLDAAFAALGNNQAGQLLTDQLEQHNYAPDLASMRILADEHPDGYWESSLYTLWLGALRTLSPPGTVAPQDGLPTVATTEAWGRRVLNTQLGSWSQLRHDTLLYVKQSYTVGTVCEFPDAYVDPYPQFFEALVRFAKRGTDLVAGLELAQESGYLAQLIPSYFQQLASVAATLQEMAEHQRTGTPHSAEHLSFINDVVKVSGGGSGPPSLEGWYGRLFMESDRALEYDPIIADVHTDPGGEERPPRVLHVATGSPRLMVVMVDSCSGPRLYAGPVFSYHETAPEGLDRITDEEWKARVDAEAQPSPPWLSPVIAE